MTSQQEATAKIDWTVAARLACQEAMTANNTDMHTIHNARFGVDLIGSTKAARLASDAMDSQPDLLYACEALLEDVLNLGSFSIKCRPSVVQARDAIAKAKPEPVP